MHNAFTWSSIIAGFLSGALWFYASGGSDKPRQRLGRLGRWPSRDVGRT